jgi:hypothetical protein
MPKRTFITAVVNTEGHVRKAISKFAKYTGKWNQVLFLYNIGPDLAINENWVSILDGLDRNIVLFNCDSDLLTKKEYGTDYLTAFADATVIATQLAGTECDDFKYINFFSPNATKRLHKSSDDEQA